MNPQPKKEKVHFSSLRLDWKTPKAVYQTLDAEFTFDHDPCPPKHTIDGLKSEWGGVFIRESSLWPRIAKVDSERLRGMEEGQDSRIPHPEPDGHEMVARILHEGYRDTFYQRPLEVRRSEESGTVSKRNSNF